MKYVALFIFVLILNAIILFAIRSFAYVRTVYPKTDEIMTVNAAIGIATIIQTPEPIQSAIIGDASAFEVQYLNNAVTIKPLRYGVRTNLYLVTKDERYNLRLITVDQNHADYVVYIKDGAPKAHVYWRVFNRFAHSDSMIVHLLRVGHSPAGFILIDGRVLVKRQNFVRDDSSANPKPLDFLKPSDFWIFQGKTPKPINTLYLSRLRGRRARPISFSLAVRAADLERNKPLTIEVKHQNDLRVVVPESVLWR